MKGAYVLLLNSPGLDILVGSLGRVSIPRGLICYIGSAKGPGGLKARIMRHFRRDKVRKWHIDYLTTNDDVKVMEAAVYNLPKEYECKLADMLRNMMFKPIKGFGSSDCRCISHLYRIDMDFDRIVSEISGRVRVKPIKLDP